MAQVFSATNKATLFEDVEKYKNNKVTELPADALALLNFLELIVDISYRNKYEKTVDDQRSESYGVGVTSEE